MSPDYELRFYCGQGSGKNGVEGDHIMFCPAYTINEADVDYIVDRAVKVVNDFFNEFDLEQT